MQELAKPPAALLRFRVRIPLASATNDQIGDTQERNRLPKCLAVESVRRVYVLQLADGRYQLANTSKVTRAKFAAGPLMHAELLVSQDWRPAASIFGGTLRFRKEGST